jgi:hypothetical protein
MAWILYIEADMTTSQFLAAVSVGQKFTGGHEVSEVMADRTFAYILKDGKPYMWREIIRRRDGSEAVEGLTPA